jgi:hypothetical protein
MEPMMQITGSKLLRRSPRSYDAVLVSHQLEGHTDEWWDAYMNVHEEPGRINWQEF